MSPAGLGKPLGLKHIKTRARSLRKFRVHGLGGAFELGDLHLCELLDAALDLRGLGGFVAEALDELLHVLDFLFLLFPFGLKARPALLAFREDFS